MTEEYKLKLEDAGKTLEVDGNDINDQTEIVVPDDSVNFPIGTQIKINRTNEKAVFIKPENKKVVINFSSKGLGNFTFYIPKFTEAQIRKRALNEWHVNAKGAPLTFGEGGNEIFTQQIDGILYRIHIYNEIGENEFRVIGGAGEVEYLVIAGGGGGAGERSPSSYASGGGGGAGGYRSSVPGELSGRNSQAEPVFQVVSKAYSVFVGNGGRGGIDWEPVGENGQNSYFDNIVSIGGGGGSAYFAGFLGVPASNGGSGGGGGSHELDSPGFGTVNQGYDGGSGHAISPWWPSGGGGGAGQIGQNGASAIGGKGGDGLPSSITGELVYRAGGGGGGIYANSDAPGIGGLGGGGNGAIIGKKGFDADSNTGGGGGGGSGMRGPVRGFAGGNGSSGIVIIRYRVE